MCPLAMDSSTRNRLLKQLLNDRQFSALTSNAARAEYLMANVLRYEDASKMVCEGVRKARLKAGKCARRAKSRLEEAQIYLQQGELDAALKAIHKAILYSDDDCHRWKMFSVKSDIHSALKEYRAALYAVQVAARIKGAGLDMDLVCRQLNCLVTARRFASAIKLIDEVLSAQPAILGGNSRFSKASFEGIKQRLVQDGYTENLSRDLNVERRKRRSYYSHQLDARCRIEDSPVVGRHVVATKDIPERTVLLVERPYSLWLEPRYRLRRCSACYLELGYKFYPCEHCTELVFCDPECFQQAWQTQHRFECGIVALLHRLTSPSAHVFRVLSRIGPLRAFEMEAQQKVDRYSVEQYLVDSQRRDVPDLKTSQEETGRAYRVAASLVAHDEKHSHQTNTYHTVLALETAILLETVHNFRQLRPHFFAQFVALVAVNIRRTIFNVFGWHEFDSSSRRSYVASCMTLVGSHFNHSCVPNANWEWKDGTIRFVARVAIPQGEQISITYGPNKDMAYAKRQQRLNQYFFACNCPICLEDACRESNLRCPTCHGPVLYKSTLNEVRHLSGKCLSCCRPHPQFEKSIFELTSAQEGVKTMASFLLVHCTETILQRTIEHVEKMSELSLQENESLCQSILAASRIFEHCDLAGLVTDERRIDLALLINEALPLFIPPSLVDGQTLASLKFWFHSLAEYMLQLSQQGATGDRPSDVSIEPIWTTAAHFHSRLERAMKGLVGGEAADEEVARRIIDEQSRRLDKMLAEMYAQYVRVNY